MESPMKRLLNLVKAHRSIANELDPRIEDAMLRVNRAHYCPSPTPYADTPYSIGHGATISAPHMHAHALMALKDKLVDGARVLDVGSGSGYLTSCIAHMIGPTGVVYGVDHMSELVELSKSNIQNDCKELLESGRVKLIVADGRAGLPDHAPFDAIHVGAVAPDLPDKTKQLAEPNHVVKLVSQLKEGGRMVLPVQRGDDQWFESVDKLPGGKLERRDLLRVVYVPLTDVSTQLGRKPCSRECHI